MRACDAIGCDAPAVWLAFAAYDIGGLGVHPELARYPGAIARSCAVHLSELLLADGECVASTHQYVLQPVQP